VTAQYGAIQFDRTDGDPTSYINNTHLTWNLVMNGNVVDTNIHTTGFTTEYYYDYLMINDTTTFTGYWGDNWIEVPPNGSQERTFATNFTTDSSNNGQPPNFDLVQFKCTTQRGPINSFTIDSRGGYAEGFLLGTGDNVYMSTTQYANQPLQISLQSLATVSTDFDLYASATTAFPGDTFTWHSFSFTPNEFITIPATSSQRTIYIGVNAFSGGGHFSVHVTTQQSTQPTRLTVCTPGFTIDTSKPSYTNFANTLKNTSLRMYSASRGNLWISGYDIYNPTACTNHPCSNNMYTNFCSECNNKCQICMDAVGDLDQCTIGQVCPDNGEIAVRVANIGCSNYSDGSLPTIMSHAFTWAHEFSHQAGIGAEEYQPSGSFCGHTLLNGPINSNFWCSAFDHCLDGTTTVDTGHAWICNSGGDNWSHAPSTWYKPAAATSTEPDQYLFNAWNQPAMDSVDVAMHSGAPP
jgi:hypothetical protein